MFNFLRVLLASFFLFSSVAFANYFIPPTSFTSSQRGADGSFGSISSAHSASIEAWKSNYPREAGCATFTPPSYKGGVWGSSIGGCAGGGFGYYPNCPSGSSFDNTKAMCQVTQCPTSTIPNKLTGVCEPEPTNCEVGEITSHLFPSKKFGDFYVTLAPQQMCQNSCVVNQVTTSSGTKGCIPFVEGRYCYAQFSVTDEKCEANDDLPQAPQVDESTAIDPKDEDQEDGTNSSNCSLVVDQEGRHVYNCNPPPEQGNCPDGWLLGADGSTCYRDPNADKDPEAGDGGSTGEGGEGEGGSSGGGETGGGEGSEGGDKQGDVLKKFDENNKLLADIKKAIQDKPVGGGGAGGGDGSHNNPDKDKGSVSGGDGCDSEPTCVGDVIQCAILAQNHKSRCEAKELADFEKHKDDISSLFQGEEFQIPVGEDIEVESFLTGHTRWLPSNCPRPERVTLGTNGQSLSLSYDPMCKLANSISPLIIILATLFATVYIGRSSGS